MAHGGKSWHKCAGLGPQKLTAQVDGKRGSGFLNLVSYLPNL
jgi:hypothetical protein